MSGASRTRCCPTVDGLSPMTQSETQLRNEGIGPSCPACIRVWGGMLYFHISFNGTVNGGTAADGAKGARRSLAAESQPAPPSDWARRVGGCARLAEPAGVRSGRGRRRGRRDEDDEEGSSSPEGERNTFSCSWYLPLDWVPFRSARQGNRSGKSWMKKRRRNRPSPR